MGPRVKIVGDHPWSGHRGTCTGDVVRFKYLDGEMLKVLLDEGGDVPYGHECFAGKENLRLIEKEGE